RQGLVQGRRLSHPHGSQQSEPASHAAEIQSAHQGSAGRVRLFQRRDRCADRKRRGLRTRTQALIISSRRRHAGTKVWTPSSRFGLPWSCLPPYDLAAITVICTSSGADNAPNRNGGPTGGVLMAFREFGAAAATAVTLAFAASPAHAVTEIQWWHAMTGPNNDVVVKLANDFNASQSDYKIVPTFKGSYADTLNAGIAAFRAGNAPGIMQVFEVGTATMMAAKGAIKPVSELMKEQGESFDPKSYLP